MGTTIDDCGTIFAIDADMRTVVWRIELSAPSRLARQAMVRAPTVDTEYLVSWGGLTLDEIGRLIRLLENDRQQEALDDFAEAIESLRPRQLKWSFFYAQRSWPAP